MIRVAVVDNDRLVPAGLRALLAGAARGADIEVVAAATTVEGFLASGIAVDIVLLDLQLDDGSDPSDNVMRLRAAGARVLVLSVHGDRRHVRATIRAGACGYLIKDDDGAKLAEAIHGVDTGGLVLTTELMTLINDAPPELSPQELQALFLYGTGSTLAATARRMGVAIPTVRSYLNRIRAKWALAAEQPVRDVRSLVHEYLPIPTGAERGQPAPSAPPGPSAPRGPSAPPEPAEPPRPG